jgi:Acyl-CoA reductase (LuxC)
VEVRRTARSWVTLNLGRPRYHVFAQTAGECHQIRLVHRRHDINQVEAQPGVLLCGAQESVEVGHRVEARNSPTVDHHYRLLDLGGVAVDRLAVPMQHAELVLGLLDSLEGAVPRIGILRDQTQRLALPGAPITRHVSIAYWKGGERTIEKQLYNSRNIEKIVAWGGFASMRSIREHLEPGIDLIALDPKLSASIIGRTAFDSETTMAEVAARAAFDIGHFNQAGCVNARVLYIESGTDPEGVALANRFGEMVYREIQGLPADASSPHPSFDPVLREELDGIRHSSDFRMFGGRGNEGAVIVSQTEEIVDFSERLDCRVANIVPVDRAEDALQYLTVDTQTIGIYPEELKRRLRDECALRGGQRLISLGFATPAGMSMTGPHDALQLLGRMVRWLRDDTLE